ncbi:MAG: HlyD family type I secretion periplasmic adaptor subunit, partial [Gammaproteobacteria bacterium]|nr:HlyD family type I secretion periplasmic adaptor subunit [Gammaproteobacteria bacterium]
QDVKARSELAELKAHDYALAVRESRLQAERQEKQEWDPFEDDELAHIEGIPLQIKTNEKRMFELRVRSYREEMEIYRVRIKQLGRTIEGLHGQNRELEAQQKLLTQEINNVQTLIDKGLERLPRVLALKRELHKTREKYAFNLSRISETREQIGDFNLRMLNAKTRRQEEISTELASLHEGRLRLAEKLAAAQDVMLRTRVVAPTDGIVANIRFRTQGAVMSPGAEILDLVPQEEPMIVEARVRPTDIDHVHIGQNAMVQLSAYSYRYSTPIEGRVETVSADLIEDETSQESYYAARIRVPQVTLESLADDIELTPGMPIEVFITTDARTVVSYLTQPLVESFNRAFREP